MSDRDAEYLEAAEVECGEMTREELLRQIAFLFKKADDLTRERYRHMEAP